MSRRSKAIAFAISESAAAPRSAFGTDHGGPPARRNARALKQRALNRRLEVERIGFARLQTDDLETAPSVKIGAISYRARCTEARCKNVVRLLLIYADAGGRPISHPVLCYTHGRERIARQGGRA
jgi:hypothetical protein